VFFGIKAYCAEVLTNVTYAKKFLRDYFIGQSISEKNIAIYNIFAKGHVNKMWIKSS